VRDDDPDAGARARVREPLPTARAGDVAPFCTVLFICQSVRLWPPALLRPARSGQAPPGQDQCLWSAIVVTDFTGTVNSTLDFAPLLSSNVRVMGTCDFSAKGPLRSINITW